MARPRQHMKDVNFSTQWMDLTPDIPYPKKDWISQKWFDIPYGKDPLQKVDIYLPNENTRKLDKYPLLIIIHGGGFTHMDKADWDVYPGFFWLEKGYAVASINYRLAPKHKFPAGVDDCYNAVKFIIDHASEYQLDTHNIFIMGPSAGGSLTLITGLRLFNEQYGQDYSIKALAPLCPVTDLSADFTSARGPLYRLMLWYMFRAYLGRIPKRGQLDLFDVSYYVKDAIPPIFFQLGRHDPVIKVDYIESLAKELKHKGEVIVDILEDGYHMGATKHFFIEENIKRYLDFFEEKIV
ncbi:alpha/beta hydrolase [Clostridia bacterium]|nr:alpha/beta hydrolase [Clostridia bacterium]